MKRKTELEIGNLKNPAKETHTKGTLLFSVVAVVGGRKCMLPEQGLCTAGHTPAPPSQGGFVSSCDGLLLEQIGSTSFVIEFSFHTVVHFCLSMMGLKRINAVHVLPNTGQPGACVKV